MKQIMLAATVLLIAAMAVPHLAAADSITFNVQNNHPNRVQLEFYSQDRNHAWPGGGQADVLDDGAPHSYPLSCQTGEQICYGAWVDGNASIYWGSGLDDQYGCDACCFTCGGGSTPLINLNP